MTQFNFRKKTCHSGGHFFTIARKKPQKKGTGSMIVAESIGFAATHSISEILGGIPGYEVSHGSQDFIAKHPIGQGSQTPEDFVAAMQASAQAGRSPVAVHTLLPPQLMKPVCDAQGVTYWLLVREPCAQIESCYAWAAKSVLSGNAAHFSTVLQQSYNDVINMKVPSSLSNCLYAFACHHVLSFNFLAIGLGAPTRKMEQLLTDEATFREAFAVPEDAPLPHFQGDQVHRASHRSKAGLEALADPDREALQQRYALNVGGRGYSITDMNALLGY